MSTITRPAPATSYRTAERLTRRAFAWGTAAAVAVPVAAAASLQDDERRFLAQCDASITVERLADAPYFFIGKKVVLRGVVGPITDPDRFELYVAKGAILFVVVFGSSAGLKPGQQLRVLGTVEKPMPAHDDFGGVVMYAVVRKAYAE